LSREHTPSVVRRITTRLIIITLAAAALSYTWLLYQVHFAADRLAEGSLIEEARQIARDLRVGPDGVTLKVPREMRGDSAAANGNFRYSVTDEQGKILFSTRWPPTGLDNVSIFDSERSLYETSHEVPASLDFFGAVAKAHISNRTLTVSVERNSRHLETIMDTLLQEFFMHGAWVYVLLLLGLLIVSILTIRGAISPVERLSTQAAMIGPRSTDRRLSEAGVPREILGFVQAVNSALDRLDAGFQVQREFTADAAHELRTPLAVLGAHIDTLDNRNVARELRRDVDGMAHIVTQLLRIARLDSMVVDPQESCDLSETVIAVASLLIPAALDKNKRIEVRGADAAVWAAADADLVFHALRNLVDNAMAYSGSAANIEIVVGKNRTVRVIDHGSGIPAHLAERVFRRFWRSDRSGEGSGLGLSIVKRSVELCGGQVSLAETPGGGATFILGFEPGKEPGAETRLAAPDTLTPIRVVAAVGALTPSTLGSSDARAT
jgi:signal transduction histidine kinase